MTTSRSDPARGGALPPSPLATPPGCLRPEKGQGAASWPARAGWLAVALGLGGPLAAQELQFPSGLSGTLYDVVLEGAGGAMAPDAFTQPDYVEDSEGSEGLGDEPLDLAPAGKESAAGESAVPASGLARFRLVVPGLGEEGAGYDRVAGDFLWLCEEVALPALAANGWTPTEVVVTLSDRETEFSAPAPEAMQFFEGFRIADGTCVPQAF